MLWVFLDADEVPASPKAGNARSSAAHVGIEHCSACRHFRPLHTPRHQSHRLLRRVDSDWAARISARVHGAHWRRERFQERIDTTAALHPSEFRVAQEGAPEVLAFLEPHERCPDGKALSIVVGTKEDAAGILDPRRRVKRLAVAVDFTIVTVLRLVSASFASRLALDARGLTAAEARAVGVPVHPVGRVTDYRVRHYRQHL